MNHQLAKKEFECGNRLVRLTRTKAAIAGQYSGSKGREGINLIRKKNGTIEVKWHGHIPLESNELQECDMGHTHPVVRAEHWTWNYCVLSPEDIETLREFLA